MADEADGTPYGPGGRGFYGAVTVSERGQISLPAKARRDLGISPGDKLLVLGDPAQGLALMTVDRLLGNMDLSPVLKSAVRDQMGEAGEQSGPEGPGGDADRSGGKSA
ncbi:AbrB/MazE/SpoVT family DNA-binding domain-containing protein [Nocardiopsis oceani]